MAEGIKSALKCLQELRMVLEPSFGPYGKDILLKSNTGKTYVTKSGLSVLRQLEIKHPIGALIKNNIDCFSRCTGDLCKTYALVLTHLIELIHSKFINDVSSTRARDMQNLLSLLSMSFTKIASSLSLDVIYFALNEHLKSLNLDPDELYENYFDGVLEASLANKHNMQTKNVIKGIIKDIFKILSFTFENLEYLIYNFEMVCVNVHGLPLNYSRVIIGAIIERECVPSRIDWQNCCFIVLCGDLSRTSGDDIFLNLTKDCSIQAQLDATVISYQNIINVLKHKKINVIFAEQSIPKQLGFLLQSNRIAYVEHVLKDDLLHLCSLYETSFLSGLYDIFSLEKNVIGQISFFKSCTLGKQLCCHLGPAVLTNKKRPNLQILLCPHSDGIGREYSETIHNLLKMLSQCFNSDHATCSVMPACGVFEMFLANNCSKILVRDPAFDKTLQHILTESLFTIPKLLFGNSSKHKAKRFLHYLPCRIDSASTTELNLVGINVKTGDFVDASGIEVYEPLSSKVLLVKNVLELCSQIIRIDRIVPIIKPICKVNENSEIADA